MLVRSLALPPAGCALDDLLLYLNAIQVKNRLYLNAIQGPTDWRTASSTRLSGSWTPSRPCPPSPLLHHAPLNSELCSKAWSNQLANQWIGSRISLNDSFSSLPHVLSHLKRFSLRVVTKFKNIKAWGLYYEAGLAGKHKKSHSPSLSSYKLKLTMKYLKKKIYIYIYNKIVWL